MILAEHILASLLWLATPGASVYSVVEARADEPAPCAEPTIICRAPWRDHSGSWGKSGRLVRYEQRDEAIVRYWTIASELALVVEAVASGAPDAPAWPASEADQLRRLLTAVIYHESGARRDVHSGRGKWSRGDDGRSICLGQLMAIPKGVPRQLVEARGWKPRDLLGVEAEPTRRCLTVVADGLARAYAYCRQMRAPSIRCTVSVYGGAGQNVAPVVRKRLGDRVRTFERLATDAPTTLTDEVRALLGLAEVPAT